MPISPPQFHVQALSPAALLQERDRRSPILDTLDRLSGFAMEKRMREESDERQAALRRELQRDEQTFRAEQRELGERDLQHRQFFDDIREGHIRAVPEGDFSRIGLPGDTIIDKVPTPEGIEGTYVRSRDVTMAKPFEEFDGRETFEGSTYADAVDPVTGQFSPRRAAGVTRGEIERVRARIEALPGELSSTKQAMLAELDLALEDDRFTYAEETQILDQGLDATSLANYDHTVAQIRRLDREQAAQLGTTTMELLRTRQVLDDWSEGPPRVRDLRPDEAHNAALVMTGQGGSLTDEERAIAERTMRNSRERMNAPRMASTMRDHFVRAAMPSAEDDHLGFIGFLRGMLYDDGEVRDVPLRGAIQGATGATSISQNHIADFAKDPSASAPYRMAYALWATGIHSRETYNQYKQQKFAFPFDDNKAAETLSELYPSFENAPRRPTSLDNRDARGAPPQTGAQEESTRSQGQSDFAPARVTFQNQIRNLDPESRGIVQDAVRSRRPDQIVPVLRSLLEPAEAAARADSDVTPAQRARANSLASWYRSMIQTAETNPQRFRTLADSVLIPAIGGER